MRKIQKSTTVPESLKSLVPPASGAAINDSLYKGADVKEQLWLDHHGKCVYCECRLNGDYGHVEHFRPKRGYTIPPSNVLITPGYYWLAYDWSNLLLSCSKCNISFKANHFALEDESKRNIKKRDISGEAPLLINPVAEDPSDHIEFHQHIAAPKLIGGVASRKGSHTIELLQLNLRADLVDNRRRVWEQYEYWKKVERVAQVLIDTGTDAVCGQALLDLAADSLSKMADADAEYSAMFL